MNMICAQRFQQTVRFFHNFLEVKLIEEQSMHHTLESRNGHDQRLKLICILKVAKRKIAYAAEALDATVTGLHYSHADLLCKESKVLDVLSVLETESAPEDEFHLILETNTTVRGLYGSLIKGSKEEVDWLAGRLSLLKSDIKPQERGALFSFVKDYSNFAVSVSMLYKDRLETMKKVKQDLLTAIEKLS